MADKVNTSPFRVPELIEMQLKVAEKLVLGHCYDCNKASLADNLTPGNKASLERDTRVWDDVQALLNELRWGLMDLESRGDMPFRIHQLAKRIAKNCDE